MRFCMVTTFYPPFNFGGDGIFVQQLAGELARRGHHVEIVHSADAYRLLKGAEPDAAEPDAAEPAAAEPETSVTVHRLRSRFGALSPLATHQTGRPTLQAAQIRAILGRGFDVIHYHNPSLVGGAGVLTEGSAAVKLCTLHEYWFVCPTHMLFKYDRAPCTAKRCVLCTLAHRRPPQWWRYSGMMQTATRHVDVFLTGSRFARDKHHEMGFRAPIVVLPYFTAPGPAVPGAGEPSSDAPYFLFVGRLVRLKGLQTLIPVFARHPRARLLVAGTGPYEATLREMAASAPNVVFLGHQSGERLRRLYAGAVALIVPSLWYEVFGLVIIEAFAQHTPAIVRNMGAMPDLIAESGGGIVYETEAELVEAMHRLLAEPEWRTALGQQGYDAMRRQWSPEPHVSRYLEVIEDAMSRRALVR